MERTMLITCGLMFTQLINGPASGAAGGAANTQSAANPGVGVVNIAQVFESFEMTRDLEQRFDQARRGISDQADNRRQAIDQQVASLEAFDPASRDFAQRRTEVRRLRVEYQVWLEMEEQRLKEEHMLWLRLIYDNVTDAVGLVAKRRGIDLVVTNDELSPDAPDSLALRREILLKKVLYFSPRVDLTAEVLRMVNEQYEQDGGSESLQAPPPAINRPRAIPSTGQE